MKKVIGLLIAVLSIISCSKKEKGYTIQGMVQIKENALVKLHEYRFDTGWILVDSTRVKNNKFFFKGSLNHPKPYYITVEEIDGCGIVLVENKDILVEYEKGDLSSIKVSGSETNNKYREFSGYLKNKFDTKLKDLYPILDKAKVENDKKLEQETLDEINLVISNLVQEIINYIKKEPNSIVPIFTITEEYKHLFSKGDLKLVLDNIEESIQDFYNVKELRVLYQGLMNKSIGSPIQHLSFADTSGNLISTETLNGKYWLLDFWSSKCGPCRKENPKLEKVYQKYKSKGFEIYGVSFDSKRDEWIKAMNDDGISWINVCELKGWANQAKVLYAIEYLPQNLLVDKDGIIIASNLNSETLAAKLEEVYK